MEMLCPKCHNLMRRYERNGVVVDQCTECSGIFLDKGELEHLVDGEMAFNRHAQAAPPPPPPPPGYGREPYYDDRRYDDRRRYDDDRYYRKRRRRNFFDELFDFD